MFYRCALIPTVLHATLTLAQPTTNGTEHWVTYMENLDLQFNTPPYFQLVISAELATQGEVIVPATGFSIPFSVEAMHDTVLTLPDNIYYPEGDETIFDFGMKVVSDEPVSVYAYHNRLYFSEATMILPTERLGTDYTVLAHEDDLYGHPSEFVVLATQDSTEVIITPSVVTVGFRPPGVPFSVWLNEGQAFQLQANGDLSGSRVNVTDQARPVAVFAGAQQAVVNCDLSADDHLYQQIEPRTAWGTVYDIVPFKLRGGDQVRIVGGTDGTLVGITGQSSFTLDSAQVVDVTITVPSRITSSAPISVGQFNESQSCNPAIGDPCYLLCRPADLVDQRAIWSALTASGTPEHFVNVSVIGDAVPPIVILDGVNVSGQFVPMAGAFEVYTAQFSIAEGEHELYCPTGCLGSAYGFGEYNSYAFHLGYGTTSTPQSVDEGGLDQPSAVTLLLGSGDQLAARMLGMDAWVRLSIIDATGRRVLSQGTETRQALTLPMGSYTATAIGRSGSVVVRRLFVTER
jgi:IgGFc binding protein